VELTREEAERLLALSREADWAFPTSLSSSILVRPDAGPWLERLAPQRDAFGEAASTLIEVGDEDAAAELAANVWRLWLMAGDIAGGRTFLAAVLDGGAGKPSRARALALYGDGLLAFKQGAREESRKRNEAALDAAREVEDDEAKALALLGLSRVAFLDGDFERGRSLAAEAREFTREMDPSMAQAPLHMLAQGTRFTGDYDQAAALFTESLELNRRLGDHGMVAVELHNLGHVEIHRGNVDAAERHFAECADPGSAVDPYSMAMSQLNQAMVAFARGDLPRAATLLDGARSTLKKDGIDLAADDTFEIDWLGRELADER
jgi:tetratricopeptide (TPR) repeat protein